MGRLAFGIGTGRQHIGIRAQLLRLLFVRYSRNLLFSIGVPDGIHCHRLANVVNAAFKGFAIQWALKATGYEWSQQEEAKMRFMFCPRRCVCRDGYVSRAKPLIAWTMRARVGVIAH